VFLWTGALRWWVWAAIVAALIAQPIGRWVWRAHREFIIVPHRAAVAAGVIAARRIQPRRAGGGAARPAGDEPHYLIITQSLLADHDLQIENNHRPRRLPPLLRRRAEA